MLILAAFPAGNAAKMRMQMLKIPNFCDYLRDAASGDKTFLGPNSHEFDVSFAVVRLW